MAPNDVPTSSPPAADAGIAQRDALHTRLRSSTDPAVVRDTGHKLLQMEPADAVALYHTARAHARRSQHDEAIVLLQRAAVVAPERTEVVALLADQAARTGQLHLALCAASRWLDMEPFNARARLLLAALYGSLGHDEISRHHARRAAGAQPLVEQAQRRDAHLRVLVLQTVASGSCTLAPNTASVQMAEGHNNLPQLLDPRHVRQYILRVDGVPDHPGIAGELPAIDLVYNGITDPERCREALATADQLCAQLADQREVPVINPPAHVLACTRDGNAARLAAWPQLIVPQSIALGRLVGDIGAPVRAAITQHGLRAPVILRAAGYQGGRNMHLITDPAQCNIRLQKPAEVFLVQYHDVSYVDRRLPEQRLYPKYRAMLVGDTLYPCHRFVAADEFNVHRSVADPLMRRHEWLRGEQAEYLRDPSAHLPANLWRELESALRGLGLDYVGVDFAPVTGADKAGQLVVFEINPAMRNRLTELPPGDPVHEAWKRITAAVHRLFCQRAGVAPWAFALPAPRTGGGR